jgi:hypothetical protein
MAKRRTLPAPSKRPQQPRGYRAVPARCDPGGLSQLHRPAHVPEENPTIGRHRPC